MYYIWKTRVLNPALIAQYIFHAYFSTKPNLLLLVAFKVCIYIVCR